MPHSLQLLTKTHLVHPCVRSGSKILVLCNSLQSEAAARIMLTLLTQANRLSIIAAAWCRRAHLRLDQELFTDVWLGAAVD